MLFCQLELKADRIFIIGLCDRDNCDEQPPKLARKVFYLLQEGDITDLMLLRTHRSDHTIEVLVRQVLYIFLCLILNVCIFCNGGIFCKC